MSDPTEHPRASHYTMGHVVRPRRGMVLSLLGMAGLRGRLGARTIIASSPFSIVERVSLRSSIASRTFILKSSTLPMRAEGAALYWVGEHVVSAAQLLAVETHERGEWVLMTHVPLTPINPADEAGITELAHRLALFHSLTLGYPFPNLTHYHAEHWQGQQRVLWERLELLGFLPRGDPQFETALLGALAQLIELLAVFTPDHFSMVHGDLDVSNVVLTEQGTQALDWGLARVDLPMVDLAHLLDSARLTRAAKERIAAHYFETLEGEWPFEPPLLRRLGSLLYHLFFLDWHTRAIYQERVPAELFTQDIETRLHQLANAF